MKKITKRIKKLSPKSKIILGAFILGGVTFATIKITRSLKAAKLKRELEKNLIQETTDAKEYLTSRTLSDASAKNVAEQLFVAMDGMGTDTTTIKRLLIDENPTSADIVAINQFFGTKEYGTFGSPWFGSGDPLDLRGWLKREISDSSSLYALIVSKFNTAGLKM